MRYHPDLPYYTWTTGSKTSNKLKNITHQGLPVSYHNSLQQFYRKARRRRRRRGKKKKKNLPYDTVPYPQSPPPSPFLLSFLHILSTFYRRRHRPIIIIILTGGYTHNVSYPPPPPSILSKPPLPPNLTVRQASRQVRQTGRYSRQIPLPSSPLPSPPFYTRSFIVSIYLSVHHTAFTHARLLSHREKSTVTECTVWLRFGFGFFDIICYLLCRKAG